MRDLIGASVQASEAHRSRNGTDLVGPVSGVIASFEIGFGNYPEELPPLWVCIRTAAGEEVYAWPEEVSLL